MSKPGNKEINLFNTALGKKIDPRENILFEQYKIYIEMMDKVSERRYLANSFFLTINTVLVGLIAGFGAFLHQSQLLWVIIACSAGFLLSYTWRRLIVSYKELNSGKFTIIHMLESRLPANLFAAEWDVLGKGIGPEYTPFSRTELNVPIVFMVLYVIIPILIILEIII